MNPNQAEIRLGPETLLPGRAGWRRPRHNWNWRTKLEPDFADARVSWARVLEAQGKRIEAERQYEEALQLLKALRALVSPKNGVIQ